MKKDNYCIGVDFGTDSVRCLIVDAANGSEIASAVSRYPRWNDGAFCDPVLKQFRQHPADYLESLEQAIGRALSEAGNAVRSGIRAISVDTTGSTPVAVDETGTPLALQPAFAKDPDAMFILWKDHSSIAEAAEINAHAKKFSRDYLRYVGGIYSSEWFWSKLLHVLRSNRELRRACYSWVEHADWMPFLLTGGRHVQEMKRGICTAGHKALWAEAWGGLPPEDFFSSLDSMLAGFRKRLYAQTYTADQCAGTLCAEWAGRLGLGTEVKVGIGAMDAHMGAVGGQIAPHYLSKVMGTSTCDMMVARAEEMQDKFVPGICGMVNGSIIPGMIGMEAGQSAFGDVYAWFRNLLAWPLKHLAKYPDPLTGEAVEQEIEAILPALSLQAEKLEPEADSELSIDWFNGRRTPDANAALKGAILGLNLGSDAPRIFRSLAESTCFGAKAIVERFISQGIPIHGLTGVGGIAGKSPFIMQMLADVTGMPVQINRSGQCSALGTAMFAATVAGIYPKVEDAMNAMGQGFGKAYTPRREKTGLYAGRYEKYRQAGRFFEDNR